MVHWYNFIPGVNEKSEVMESGKFPQNSKTKCRPRFRKNFFQKWSQSIVSTCIFIFCHKFGYQLGINSSHIGTSSFQFGIYLFHQMFYCIGIRVSGISLIWDAPMVRILIYDSWTMGASHSFAWWRVLMTSLVTTSKLITKQTLNAACQRQPWHW